MRIENLHAIVEETLISSAHGTFGKMLNPKSSRSNFKWMEIIQSMFCKHNGT